MHSPHRLFLLAAICLGSAGCIMDDPNREMTPLDGIGPRPNVKNRFPEGRGGFQQSRADKMDEDMTRYERVVGQY